MPDGSGSPNAFIYICHHCLRPTFFDADQKQTPGVRAGEDVKGIDEATVEKLHNEARDCFSKNAFTAAVSKHDLEIRLGYAHDNRSKRPSKSWLGTTARYPIENGGQIAGSSRCVRASQ